MIRFSLFAVLALGVNLLLFSLMSAMVQHSRLRLDATDVVALVDFVRPREQARPPPRRRVPPPQAPPPARLQALPRPTMPSPPKPSALRVAAPRVNLQLDLQLDGGPYIGDMLAPPPPAVISARDLTPLVTLPPRYPRSARSRRIEGFVEVEFTVEKDGTVADIHVVNAEPSGVFERSAQRAVRRWKFQAHVVDGEPVAVRARQRMDFKLRSR